MILLCQNMLYQKLIKSHCNNVAQSNNNNETDGVFLLRKYLDINYSLDIILLIKMSEAIINLI